MFASKASLIGDNWKAEKRSGNEGFHLGREENVGEVRSSVERVDDGKVMRRKLDRARLMKAVLNHGSIPRCIPHRETGYQNSSKLIVPKKNRV